MLPLISSRSLLLLVVAPPHISQDVALGGGGYPKGRVVEIYGPESSGKTTLALHAIAECQKTGGTAAFVDAEHALDPVYGAWHDEWKTERRPIPVSFLFFYHTLFLFAAVYTQILS